MPRVSPGTREILTDPAEVPFPAWAAAAGPRGGAVAVAAEPGALGGQRLGRLHGRAARLGHQRSAQETAVESVLWLEVNTRRKSSDSVADKASLSLSKQTNL